MNRQPPAVHVVGLIAQQICELGLQNGNDKVKGRIGVAHNEEQSRFPISNSIELHFVIRHQVAQLFDVKGCKPCAAGNQDALGGFSRNELSRTFLQNKKLSTTLFFGYRKLVLYMYLYIIILQYASYGDSHNLTNRDIILTGKSQKRKLMLSKLRYH